MCITTYVDNEVLCHLWITISVSSAWDMHYWDLTSAGRDIILPCRQLTFPEYGFIWYDKNKAISRNILFLITSILLQQDYFRNFRNLTPLTHCDPVTPYNDTTFVHIAASRYQAITWTNVDLSSKISNGILKKRSCTWSVPSLPGTNV